MLSIVTDFMYGLVRAPGAMMESFRLRQPLAEGTSRSRVIFSKNGLERRSVSNVAEIRMTLTYDPITYSPDAGFTG